MSKRAIIVLGSKEKEITEKRVKFVESKVKKFNNLRIIFSGTKQEVEWMKKYSKLNAIYENKSETTLDNLLNSKNLIGDAEKVWIVTDKSHEFRTKFLARKVFKKIPFEVIGVEVPFYFKIKKLWYEISRLIKHAL
ncbi:MAG: YdcF family protein [candidate division WOR-3 bacterium]